VSTVNCAEPEGVVVNSCLHKYRKAIYSLILYFQREKVSTKLYSAVRGWGHNGHAASCVDDVIPIQCLDFILP
jgi:hypothetical protein